jgi:hypothetical protein
MVNGDDGGAKGNRYLLKFWREIAYFFGFEESVGKTYFSKKFIQINSELFYRGPTQFVDCDDLRNPGKQISRQTEFNSAPCVNLGLVYGYTRSEAKVGITSAVESSRDYSLGSRVRDMLRGHPEERKRQIFRLFRRHNWDLLSAIRVPWFMPEWCGGLGFPWILSQEGESRLRWLSRSFEHDHRPDLEDYEFGPSEEDLRKATCILMNWSKNRPLLDKVSPTWRVHSYVVSRLPCRPLVVRGDVKVSSYFKRNAQNYTRLYGSLCVQTLLQRKLDQLMDPKPDQKALRCLRHNERLWSRAAYMSMSPLSKFALERKELEYIPLYWES